MIHTIRTVAVGDQESKIDSPIILYRGDREVEVEFTINGSKFTFTNGGNVIKSTNATHGQLVINTPTGENMFSEVTECHDGKVVFVITKEMIDELIEVGFYSFQIRLFDESQVSRVTIPPVLKGIDIRNPIAAEDETNVVDIGLVDYAVVVKDEFEDLSTFLPDGNYNKTEWETKDVISGAKLNKIEDALYNINSNMEATDLALLNRIERINQDIHSEFTELSKEIENEMDEFQRELKNNIDRDFIDLSVEIKEDIDTLSDTIMETNEKLSNKYSVNVKDFGAVGDGITDDTLAIKNAFNYDNIEFPSGTYRVTDEISFENKNVFGSNMTHVTILGDIEDDTKAILAAGGQSVIRDITVSYSDSRITGNETIGRRVGIKLSGGCRDLPFQTGAGIYNCQVHNCGTGISDHGASVFSANFKDIRISKYTCRGFEMYGTARTGNVYDNIYITNHDFVNNNGTGDSHHAWQGFVLSGEESECTITQLNVEHSTLYQAIILEDVLGLNAGSIHIEGVELRDNYMGMVNIERTQGKIEAISFYFTRHKPGTSLIKFGAAKKTDIENDFYSDNVNFEIGTLVCKGLNRPDRATYGYEPNYPVSASTLSGSIQPFYFINRESYNDQYFVTLNRYNWITYSYGFDDREVYKNFPCNAHNSITFLKKAHMEV